MKEYLDMIVNNGNKEDMECLGEMLTELIEESYNSKRYKNKIIGMAYNYRINPELAQDVTQDMRPLGEYWSMDTVKSVVGDIPNLCDVYVVMNSLVNDYGDVISPDDVDTYIKLTDAWLNDVDGHKNKVWWYFIEK